MTKRRKGNWYGQFLNHSDFTGRRLSCVAHDYGDDEKLPQEGERIYEHFYKFYEDYAAGPVYPIWEQSV